MFLERCMWLCLIGMCLNPYSTSGASGQYSTKSAYEAFFVGAIHFRPWERIWKSWAPGKCKFFMWTAAHKKCWTAERLAKKGLPHPALCPLCDQVEETLDHLLVSCVFFPSVLVQLAAGPWTASTCPRFGWWDLRWLVGQFEQQGVLSDQKRS